MFNVGNLHQEGQPLTTLQDCPHHQVQRPHHQVQVRRIISELRCHRHSTLFLSRPWWHWYITIGIGEGEGTGSTGDIGIYSSIMYIIYIYSSIHRYIWYIFHMIIPYKSTKHSRFQMIQDYASRGLICIPPKFWCYVYKTMAQHTVLKMSGKGAGIKMIFGSFKPTHTHRLQKGWCNSQLSSLMAP